MENSPEHIQMKQQQQAPLVAETQQMQSQQLLFAPPVQQQDQQQTSSAAHGHVEKSKSKTSVLDEGKTKKKKHTEEPAAEEPAAEEPEYVYQLERDQVRNNFSDKRVDAFSEVLRVNCAYDSKLLDKHSKIPGAGAYKKMMAAISKYADLSPTQTKRATQAKALRDAQKAIASYQKLRAKQRKGGEDTNEADAVAARYALYFETFTGGNLQHRREPNGEEINAVNNPPALKKETHRYVSRRDDALFPHEPSMNDVKQLYLGDCYLQSAISSLVQNNPEALKDGMCDNGDGTVTVRFYKTVTVPPAEGQRRATKQQVPLFVTVTKDVPALNSNGDDAYSDECLWMQLLEKAYAASGLHRSDDLKNLENAQQQALAVLTIQLNQRGATAEEAQAELAALQAKQTAEMERMQHSFQNIEGGGSGDFLERFTGVQKEQIIFAHPAADHISETFVSLENGLHDWLEENPIDFPLSISTVGIAIQEYLVKKHGTVYQEKKDGTLQNVTVCSSPLYLEDIQDAMAHIDDWIEDVQNLNPGLDKAVAPFGFSAQELLSRIQRVFPPFMEKAISDNTFGSIQHRPMTGQYTNYAVDVYNYINTALEVGSSINIGTRQFLKDGLQATGKNGESEQGGIVERHAYSVIGVTERDGNRFVQLRNPWSSGEMQYQKITQPDGTVTYRSKSVDTEMKGQFYMELNDFISKTEFMDLNARMTNSAGAQGGAAV